MISARLALLSLRARAVGTTVATTGSTSLGATSSGYTRSSGSFITDGFEVGMEVSSVAGFTVSANNQATTSLGRIVTAVTASLLSCAGCATDTATSGRTVIVGVPYQRAYDNVSLTPQAGYTYVEEEFVPATTTVTTFAVASGYAEDTGLYVFKWYGLAGKGSEALRRSVDAVLARFTPGTTFTLSDGTNLRIPAEFGPKAGQITLADSGWAYVSIEIPYVGQSINAVA